MFTEIKKCRICGNEKLLDILSLGVQPQAGFFPRPGQETEDAPLNLVKCDSSVDGVCGLVQLRHSFQAEVLYGDHYGYRSGLNRSMVDHLRGKVEQIQNSINLRQGDVIIDIGSNDGTTLGFYPPNSFRLIGVDPTICKFGSYYRADIEKFPEFFSAELVDRLGEMGRVKVISSISMFYDLEQPMNFVMAIKKALAPDGIWVFEQSYLPSMLATHAYDTICHEHLEYYHLAPIMWMLKRAGLKVLNVELNDVNGGSFSVVAGHSNVRYACEVPENVERLLTREREMGIHTLKPFEEFRDFINGHRRDFISTLSGLKAAGKRVLGYGASTKGNVVLNYCGIGPELLESIVEVNPDKVGCLTPGSGIPIISEVEGRRSAPDVFVVFPWHFRSFFEVKEREFLQKGGELLFPLPELELVHKSTVMRGRSEYREVNP